MDKAYIINHNASELLATDHPFSTKKLYTDGKNLFTHIMSEGDSDLVDFERQQYQLIDVVLPYLYECMDFVDDKDFPLRYWPRGKDYGVVIDPARNFGQPILNDLGIRTETIMELLSYGHSEADISAWYGIDHKYIELAKSYEQPLAA